VKVLAIRAIVLETMIIIGLWVLSRVFS